MKYSELLPAIFASSLFVAVPGNAVDTTTQQEDTIGSFIDDTALTARIKNVLAADLELRNLTLTIDSKNSIVSITGKVASEEIKKSVTNAVKSIKGVGSVNNLVVIVPE